MRCCASLSLSQQVRTHKLAKTNIWLLPQDNYKHARKIHDSNSPLPRVAGRLQHIRVSRLPARLTYTAQQAL